MAIRWIRWPYSGLLWHCCGHKVDVMAMWWPNGDHVVAILWMQWPKGGCGYPMDAAYAMWLVCSRAGGLTSRPYGALQAGGSREAAPTPASLAPASTRWAAMVSYSTTTAIVYALSGFTFFFLIFLLIMVGLDCCAK